MYSFTADVAGLYEFSTSGNGGDTIMWARSACAFEDFELACNDDFSGLFSRVSVNLEAGDTTYVFVDSFGVFSRDAYRLTGRLLAAAEPENQQIRKGVRLEDHAERVRAG